MLLVTYLIIGCFLAIGCILMVKKEGGFEYAPVPRELHKILWVLTTILVVLAWPVLLAKSAMDREC